MRSKARVYLTVLAVALAVSAIAAAAVAWWTFRAPRPRPLEPGWEATVVSIAGDGVQGWRDGPASEARFSDPFGIAAAVDGTIYVADAGDAQRIRRISRRSSPAEGGPHTSATESGFGRTVVDSIAGGARGFADGAGAAARFDTPSGIAVDVEGNVYVADTGNDAIRRVARDGTVTTLAGDGVAGYQDGPGHQARFNGPMGIAIDAGGRILVADAYNDRIRAIQRDGTVITLAGIGVPGLLDGPAGQAAFHTPCGVAVDAQGNIHVADTGNGIVRTISASGTVTTIGGSSLEGFMRPIGIAAGAGGELYVTDERGRILEIAANGGARAIAGSTPGFRDGPGMDARFRAPAGIAWSGTGRLIVADAGNALVRLVGAPSRLELHPPASPRIAPRFDASAFGIYPLLWPVSPMDGPHEIAGTMGEARGGDGAERFHGGVDVRLDEGTPVRASRAGVVVSPVATGEFGSLNEWLRIGPITYVHVRAGRTRQEEVLDPARFVPTTDAAGRLVLVRVKRGARFESGDAIASVNRFNHVHMSVGWPGEEHNPLAFRLVRFEDTVAPTIARGGITLYDVEGQPLTQRAKGRIVVSGLVHVVVDGWDQSNGNRPNRRLGLYSVGYQVLNADRTPASGFETPRETIRFDRLLPGSDAPRIVYAPGSGIPFYGRRRTRFLYSVTNTFNDGVAAAGAWDTSRLPPGDYIVRIVAADIRGNEAVANRDLPVTVVAARP